MYSIERELQSGEKLLWQGQPAIGIKLRKRDLRSILFTFAGATLAYFFFSQNPFFAGHKFKIYDTEYDVIFLLVVTLSAFSLMQIFIIMLIFDPLRRSRTRYGLTNERAMIISGVIIKNVKSINYKNITDVNFTEKSDGSGNIEFGEPVKVFGKKFYGINNLNYRAPINGFELIPNVRNVESTLRTAQKSVQ